MTDENTQRTSKPICDSGEFEKLTRQITGYRDALGRAHARADRYADERDAAERKLGTAQDEIERLRHVLSVIAIQTNSSSEVSTLATTARRALQGAAVETAAQQAAAREDRAYCAGAEQALAIAAQSWPAAEKWLREGCGNRRAQANAVLRPSAKASG